MSLTPEQIALRREGITATDIGCIVGANPYRKPIDVWQDKKGIGAPFVEKPETVWGHKLEPLILDEYERTHNVRVERCGTFRHPKYRWAMATPDGLRYPIGASEPDGGMEVKAHGQDAMRFGVGMEYGPEGTDEVPLHELIQCEWGMFVRNLPRWDLIMFDQRPHGYVIDRDEEFIGMLHEQGERFLRDHVKADVPPPPDGSESWNDFMHRRWQENSAAYIDADKNPELRALILELRNARAAAGTAATRAVELAQKVKNAIGDKAGISFHEPDRAKAVRIHWKWSKQGAMKQWKETLLATREKAALFVSAKQPLLSDPTSPSVMAETLAEALLLLGEVATVEPVEKLKARARPFNVPKYWPKMAGEEKPEEENEETN